MKKFFMLAITMVLFAVPLFSQTVENWQDLYDNFGTLMLTYGGIAAIATFLGELAIRGLNTVKKLWKVVVVWVIAIAVSFLGSVINVGFLSEAVWYEVILWGCLSGALAGGMRSGNVLFLKTAVEFLLNLVKLKKESIS